MKVAAQACYNFEKVYTVRRLVAVVFDNFPNIYRVVMVITHE